ncbi:MAG TPA: hypothetical protein VEW07_04925 [Solirubrobacterales bacterium]|nr:hypothetical protein [Solirubrobacterales bacterium]
MGEFAGQVTADELAHALGIGERRLHRWRYEVQTIDRIEMEEALHHADSAIWEVYGVEDCDLEADAYCGRCHDTVTPIAGACPWCDSSLSAAKARRWCPREDRLIFPANDGSCWRCGTATEAIPWADCACGCGRSIPRFDPQGRAHEYALGHAPRSLERRWEVPIEPFAEYLERELERMDLIGALARAHGLPRDEVVRVLKRQVETLPTKTVRRAVWTAGRGGTGKGLPRRPGAPTLESLYPDFVRSRTCPGCGTGKAPHAELCKRCRVAQNRRDGVKPPKPPTQIRPELIAEARAHYDAGNSVASAAAEIIDRTPHTNVASTAQALSREWKRQGLEMRERVGEAVA